MAKKRVLYFDLLNIIATFCVIAMHCNSIAHHHTPTAAWYQAFAVETVCYWAVPVFLMLSGANLMGYREKYSTKEFFKKRFLRSVIPFVIWSLICAAIKQIFPWEIGEREFIRRFLFTEIESVYWFFLPLFSIYLALPALSLLKDHRKALWYICGGALVLNSVIPSIFKYLGLKWNTSLSMPLAAGLMIFPIIGYLFSVTDFSKKARAVIYSLGIFGILIRYIGTAVVSALDSTQGKTNKLFFGYSEYFSVFLACAVFVLFKYLPLCDVIAKSERTVRIIKTVSGCSLGIYLVHMIIYRWLDDFIPSSIWQWRILIPFAIYAIALAAVYLIKKIPIIKYIVP